MEKDIQFPKVILLGAVVDFFNNTESYNNNWE